MRKVELGTLVMQDKGFKAFIPHPFPSAELADFS